MKVDSGTFEFDRCHVGRLDVVDDELEFPAVDVCPSLRPVPGISCLAEKADGSEHHALEGGAGVYSRDTTIGITF